MDVNLLNNKKVNKQPLVTIITVVFNGEKFFEQTIKSIIEQSYKHIEYIVIDGGSTDGTLGIIDKYKNHISHWVSESDDGLYDAMNKGIGLANGELIGMINSDDWYELDAVSMMVDAYLSHPDKTIFHADRIDINNEGDKTIRKFNPSSLKLKYYGMTYNHPSMFISKHEYKEHLYNPQLKSLSDYQFILKAFLDHPEKIFYLNVPIVNYRLDGISAQLTLWQSTREAYTARRQSGMNFLQRIFAFTFSSFTTLYFYFKSLLNSRTTNVPEESKKLRVAIYYQDIDKPGGYPRDIRRLCNELKSDEVTIYKVTNFSDLYQVRKELDVVHIYGLFLFRSMVAALCCKLFKKPYIITTFSHLLPLALVKKYFKKQLFIIVLGRYILNNAKIVHVFTEYEKSAIKNLGVHSDISILSLGLYPEDVDLSSSDKTIDSVLIKGDYLIFLGRLDIYQKGIDLLIDGFSKYMNIDTKYKLVICGQDWNDGAKYIEDRLLKLGSPKRIIFLGEVSEEEKRQLISNSQAFIYASRFDGPPRPIRYALSLNKKILVSYQSLIADNIKKNGWGLEFEANSKAISECILEFSKITEEIDYIDPLTLLAWDKLSTNYLAMYKHSIKR